jgi:hypothetical protein
MKYNIRKTNFIVGLVLILLIVFSVFNFVRQGNPSDVGKRYSYQRTIYYICKIGKKHFGRW